MTRLDELRAKLKARQGKPGFKENCAAIEAEIARLVAEEQAKESEE